MDISADPPAVRVNKFFDEFDIDCTRPSIWSNRLKIGRDGTRDQVVDGYEPILRSKPYLMRQIHTLAGKRLACACKPSQRCHVDIIIKVLGELQCRWSIRR